MVQSSQPNVEGATNDAPPAYAATTYQPVVMVSETPPADAVFPPGSQGVSDQNQMAFQQLYHQQQHQQHQQLQAFWADQMAEVEQMSEFKVHSLPLARIKKIMKADEDVRMIAGEAPAVFAKACEMFILELTLRSWLHTEENKRRMLQKNDIAATVSRTDIFDFLVDIMPGDEVKEEGVGMSTAAMPTLLSPYVPGMAMPFGMYADQQPVAFAWPQPEQHPPPPSDGGQDE